nr:unnamed protein product [Digitaria exilis]
MEQGTPMLKPQWLQTDRAAGATNIWATASSRSDLPLASDAKKNSVTSSLLQIAPSKQTEVVPNSGTALSMAETVMQAPPRISSGPQLSVEAKKIEERTLRQYTLRPLTPPAIKSSVSSYYISFGYD